MCFDEAKPTSSRKEHHDRKKVIASLAGTVLISTAAPAAVAHPALPTPGIFELSSGALSSDDLDCDSGESRDIIDAEGRIHTIGCITLNSPSFQGSTPTYTGWNPYENAYYRCGSSYVRNQQIALVSYRGTAYASGQSCGDGRGPVTRAYITYSRNGKTLGTATSFAQRNGNGSWRPGQQKSVVVWDSLDSRDRPQNKTHMKYDFVRS